MLNLFWPRCPLETWEKTWTETRMRWLAEQFGIERMLRAEVVTPSNEYFGEPFQGTDADARRLLDQLRKWMGVERRIGLQILDDDQLPGVAGHYDDSERVVIRISRSTASDLWSLTATLAHELSHELLLGGKLLTTDVEDHEWITDLLPVFLGVGIFGANATIFDHSVLIGNFSWWHIRRRGYLSSRMLGYAHALFCFVRNERYPEWARHLRLDAVTALRDGLRYLQRTEDSVFHPDSVHRKRIPPTPVEIASKLKQGSATIRLAALWDIREFELKEPELVDLVAKRLEDRDVAIPGEAARTLKTFGMAAARAKPELVHALRSDCVQTQVGAAFALESLGPLDDAAIVDLGQLLACSNRDVVYAAARVLHANGNKARLVTTTILHAMVRAIKKCDEFMTQTLMETLMSAEADTPACLRRYFAEDSELETAAFEALKQLTTEESGASD